MYQQILYMPILNLFPLIFQCENNNLLFYPKVICWSGEHIAHLITTSILIFIVYYTNSIISYNFFISDPSSSEKTARSTGKLDSDLYTYKLFAVLIFTFFNTEDFELILVIFLFGGSIVIVQDFY